MIDNNNIVSLHMMTFTCNNRKPLKRHFFSVSVQYFFYYSVFPEVRE